MNLLSFTKLQERKAKISLRDHYNSDIMPHLNDARHTLTILKTYAAMFHAQISWVAKQ